MLSKKISHTKKNCQVKALQYGIGEDTKIFKVTAGNTSRTYEVSSDRVSEVFKLYHDSAAHPGINTTIRSIKEKYFWPGLMKDVRNYVQSCHNCQMVAALPPQPQKKLRPIPPPDQPWKHIGIDLVCDLQENTEGYKHLLVTICYLSKFCAVRLLKTKRSSDVLVQLESIYLTLGVPQIIQHDQIPEFVSKEFQEFHRKLGVDNRKTAEYHPGSNGLVEAHNKIIKTKLHKMVIETGAEWPRKVQHAVLAANTCWKRATGYSPFYLMYGREADCAHLLKHTNLAMLSDMEELGNLQIENSTDNEVLNEFSPEEWIEPLMKARCTSKLQACDNIRKDQLLQKHVFDNKVKKNSSNLKKGDQIIVRNIRKAKKMPGTKTELKYSGPMIAAEVTDSHALDLKDGSDSQYKKVPLHISRQYFPRSKITKHKSNDDPQTVVVKASRQSNSTKKLKLDTDTFLHKADVTSEVGFIVIDLETDGLIKKSKNICTRIPQILQIGFAPLEKLAHATTTVSFYVEPINSAAFRTNLKNTPFLQTFYRSYSEGSYLVKREGKPDDVEHAVPLINCIDRLIRWKQELYKDRPVYFIAHNALKFDKIVLEYNLEKLKMFPSFQSQINFAGWIDSLSIIRGIPNILQVLGYPYMSEESKQWLIWQKRPFSLGKLIEALSRRYAQLSHSKSSLQWPVFQLPYHYRTEEDEKWLFYFSRDDMIRNCKDVLKELTFHQAGDDVTGLVCILHQLNLYPKFRDAHFKRDYNIIIP